MHQKQAGVSGLLRLSLISSGRKNGFPEKWHAVAFERDLKAAKFTRCRLFGQVMDWRLAHRQTGLKSFPSAPELEGVPPV
jgi:hypothetical protein